MPNLLTGAAAFKGLFWGPKPITWFHDEGESPLLAQEKVHEIPDLAGFLTGENASVVWHVIVAPNRPRLIPCPAEE